MEQALKVEEVISPFLNETKLQWAWDAHSLGTFKECPRKYQYQIIEGWRSRSDNTYLRFGGEVHESFAQYQHAKTEGLSHEEAVYQVVRDLLYRISDWFPEEDTPEAKYRSRFKLLQTVVDYLDYYEIDPAPTYVVDGKPAIELSFQFDSGIEMGDSDITYVLCGYLDRVVNFLDDLYVLDYKTTSKTPGPYYFNQFEPDNQMSMYTLASQVILEAPVKGVIIDAIQLLVGSTRSVRSLTYRTESQLEEWRMDLTYWFGLAEHYVKNDYWPMNDKSCRWCHFREICSKAPEVREKFLESNFERGEQWNPLKPR